MFKITVDKSKSIQKINNGILETHYYGETNERKCSCCVCKEKFRKGTLKKILVPGDYKFVCSDKCESAFKTDKQSNSIETKVSMNYTIIVKASNSNINLLVGANNQWQRKKSYAKFISTTRGNLDVILNLGDYDRISVLINNNDKNTKQLLTFTSATPKTILNKIGVHAIKLGCYDYYNM